MAINLTIKFSTMHPENVLLHTSTISQYRRIFLLDSRVNFLNSLYALVVTAVFSIFSLLSFSLFQMKVIFTRQMNYETLRDIFHVISNNGQLIVLMKMREKMQSPSLLCRMNT